MRQLNKVEGRIVKIVTSRFDEVTRLELFSSEGGPDVLRASESIEHFVDLSSLSDSCTSALAKSDITVPANSVLAICPLPLASSCARCTFENRSRNSLIAASAPTAIVTERYRSLRESRTCSCILIAKHSRRLVTCAKTRLSAALSRTGPVLDRACLLEAFCALFFAIVQDTTWAYYQR